MASRVARAPTLLESRNLITPRHDIFENPEIISCFSCRMILQVSVIWACLFMSYCSDRATSHSPVSVERYWSYWLSGRNCFFVERSATDFPHRTGYPGLVSVTHVELFCPDESFGYSWDILGSILGWNLWTKWYAKSYKVSEKLFQFSMESRSENSSSFMPTSAAHSLELTRCTNLGYVNVFRYMISSRVSLFASSRWFFAVGFFHSYASILGRMNMWHCVEAKKASSEPRETIHHYPIS